MAFLPCMNHTQMMRNQGCSCHLSPKYTAMHRSPKGSLVFFVKGLIWKQKHHITKTCTWDPLHFLLVHFLLFLFFPRLTDRSVGFAMRLDLSYNKLEATLADGPTNRWVATKGWIGGGKGCKSTCGWWLLCRTLLSYFVLGTLMILVGWIIAATIFVQLIEIFDNQLIHWLFIGVCWIWRCIYTTRNV